MISPKQRKELIDLIKEYGDTEVQYGIRLGAYAPEGSDFKVVTDVRKAFEKVITLIHKL